MTENSKHRLWGHLPKLIRANSKESVEYILQALWRTRNTGLDFTDRHVILDLLQLQSDSDLDPLLACLRMLIRRCVNDNINKDEIQNLFPSEVQPEIQKLLTILLQKFQREWREDVEKEQAMTWNIGNQDTESTDPAAVINIKLRNGRPRLGETDVMFQSAKDTAETMVNQ